MKSQGEFNSLFEELKEAKNKVKELEIQQNQLISRLTGLDPKQSFFSPPSVLDNKGTIFIKCQNINEVSTVLNKIEVHSNGHRFKYGKDVYHLVTRYLYSTDSPYRPNEAELTIEFENMLANYRVSIKLTDLSEEFKNKFIAHGTRKPKDTETVYNNGEHWDHWKGKIIRTNAFKEKYLEYYGGHYKLIDEPESTNITNYLKNINKIK